MSAMLTGVAFTQIPLWVLKHQGLSFAAKCVYGILQSYVNRENPDLGAWPSYRTIAEQLGTSHSTVIAAIRELIDTRVVEREKRARENGHNASNRYRLAVMQPEPQPHVEHGSPANQGGGLPVNHDLGSPANQGGLPANQKEVDLSNQSTHTHRAREANPGPHPVTPPALPGTPLGDRLSPLGVVETGPPILDERHGPGGARMPLIARGETLAFDEGQQKLHRPCHQEVCRWRDPAVRSCMPAVLVDEFASKLFAGKPANAIAQVIAWARSDTPPAGYVAPGNTFEHWRNRWTDTQASPRQKPPRSAAPTVRTAPSAEATDALIASLTGGALP